MYKKVYLYIFLETIILFFIIIPFRSTDVYLGSMLIGDTAIFATYTYWVTRKYCNISHYVALIIITTIGFISLIGIILASPSGKMGVLDSLIRSIMAVTTGYLLSKIKKLKYRIIVTIVAIGIFITYHFTIGTFFR